MKHRQELPPLLTPHIANFPLRWQNRAKIFGNSKNKLFDEKNESEIPAPNEIFSCRDTACQPPPPDLQNTNSRLILKTVNENSNIENDAVLERKGVRNWPTAICEVIFHPRWVIVRSNFKENILTTLCTINGLLRTEYGVGWIWVEHLLQNFSREASVGFQPPTKMSHVEGMDLTGMKFFFSLNESITNYS